MDPATGDVAMMYGSGHGVAQDFTEALFQRIIYFALKEMLVGQEHVIAIKSGNEFH